MLDNASQELSSPPFVCSPSSSNEAEEQQRRRHESDDQDVRDVNTDVLTKYQACCLYASHSLSMWDSRMYEFAVVSHASHLSHSLCGSLPRTLCGYDTKSYIQIIFIQTTFPGNLLASSIKSVSSPLCQDRLLSLAHQSFPSSGIAETLCVLLFSSALGRWVDRSPRLPALLLTININRITILISCLTWMITLSLSQTTPLHIFFSVALILGMIEKLSRITNTLSMERDWVPILANANNDSMMPYTLTHLNTVMRRIDMLCKLLAPLMVSESITFFHSEKAVAALVATISTLGWVVESWCVQRVYTTHGKLRIPKSILPKGVENISNLPHRRTSARLPQLLDQLKKVLSSHYLALKYYFASPVCIPSLCAAVPHASVLTFSGTLVTYLLNAGISLTTVTVARFVGAVFEVASTFAYPWAVRRFSARTNDKVGNNVEMGERQEGEALLMQEDDGVEKARGKSELAEEHCKESIDQGDEHAVVKVGLWSICGLMLSLVSHPICVFIPAKAPPTLIPFQKIYGMKRHMYSSQTHLIKNNSN